MFDKYLIGQNSLRNTGPEGKAEGFSFGLRLGYYRGLGLSMVEDIALVIDGQAVPRASIVFRDGDQDLSLADLEHALDRRWEFGAFATIRVAHEGGLAGGQHCLAVKEVLRISYLPFPLVAEDEKLLFLSN